MDYLNLFLDKLLAFVPMVIALVVVLFAIWFAQYSLEKRYAGITGNRFRIQMVLLVLSFIGLLVVILTLPVSETTIGQLLSLLGILLSAAIALSATTFIGNIMAGFMLRAIKNFRAGDFVRVNDHFGRVTERGLFHVEIQTEDRDLTTIPNLYLVTNPVKVIRSSGTLVTGEVSLGYDVSKDKITDALVKAAKDCELEEPFVHVRELGDFSVTYRVCGLLTDVKNLISTHSKLRSNMLDSLHSAGIEIVSPTFMNQRQLSPEKPIIPKAERNKLKKKKEETIAEAIVFDKADEAESVEMLREKQAKLVAEIKEFEAQLKDELDESARTKFESKINKIRTEIEKLNSQIIEIEGNE